MSAYTAISSDAMESKPSDVFRNDTLADLDVLLWKGRQGEAILESKAGLSDSIALLTGLIFAFAVSILLDGRAAFGVGDLQPGDEVPANEIVIAFALYISSIAGLCGVLINTFLSAKIRRLLGRSAFMFGLDASAEFLAQVYEGQDKLSDKIRYNSGGTKRYNSGEIRFCARWWYNLEGGVQLFNCGFCALKITMGAFTVALFANVITVFSDWSMSVEAVRFVVMIEMVLLIGAIPGTYVLLHRSGAMADLE